MQRPQARPGARLRLTIPPGTVRTVTGVPSTTARVGSAGLGPNDSSTAIALADCANAKVVSRGNELLP